MSPPLIKLSSTSTKQSDWSPSSLAHAAIPNPQDGFHSITSEAKSTAGTETDFYDPGRTTRRYALAGLVFSGIFSISCIIAGTIIIAIHGGNGAIVYSLPSSLLQEMLALILNLIVTICTESTGFVHSISLRSALASESRLRFNVNLRLLTAAHGWRNHNGILLNGAMAILLILSYASSSIAIPNASIAEANSDGTTRLSFWIVGLPILLLGVALLLQVVIALLGIRAVKILTWSSSPFDVTVALVHHIQLTPVPSRCMRGVSDMDVYGGPTKPFEVQPSVWHTHPSTRKVIMSLWGLVVACALWAALVLLFWNYTFRRVQPSWELWSFFHTDTSKFMLWSSPPSGDVTVQWWTLSIVIIMLVQGPLTLGLHCSELIASVIRDERCWRRATRRKGLRMKTTCLNSFFTDPFSLVLFVAKPGLHWMFGLSFALAGLIPAPGNTIGIIEMAMFPTQIGNLCIALFILACFFTVVALYRPRGPQPVAYGHLQTLANLIDEWSPVMWWGHKEDGIPYCHAGTSDHPLQAVKMDCVYAGSDIMSHLPNLPLVRYLQAYATPCTG